MTESLNQCHRRARLLLAAGVAVALLSSGCGVRVPGERDGPGVHRDVSDVPDAVPRIEPRSRGGNMPTYVVLGKRYHTLPSSKGFIERGIASWYGTKFHGRKTSNGETYDMYAMSAAHTRLPLPTYARVTNLENGRQVVVRVNDRGPFHENRIIDLSYAAASRIGMLGKGTALVEIRAIDPSTPQQPSPKTRVAKAGSHPGPVVTRSVRTTPRIFLQAGAFNSSGNAQRLRKRLEEGLARPVRVIAAESGSGQVHRVQVGPLGSVEIADQITANMHHLGVREPLVVID